MWRGDRHIDNEKLDRFGEELLQTLEPREVEINTAATSPFLYRRIRVRIEAEQRRIAEERSRWFALLAGAKHAIPIFTVIATTAMIMLWYLPARVTPKAASQVSASSSSQLTMTVEISPLTNDEMITSIVGWNERNTNQRKEQQ